MRRDASGAAYIWSERSTPPFTGQLSDHLRRWAHSTPSRTFLAQRDSSGQWRTLSYAAARQRVDAYSQALLDHGHSARHPVGALAGNSIEHILLMLAAMQVGITSISISMAYSRHGGNFQRLRYILQTIRPTALLVDTAQDVVPVFEQLALQDIETIVPTGSASEAEGAARWAITRGTGRVMHELDAWAKQTPGLAVEQAYAKVGAASVAKILLTSGSTGAPKGTIITQGMMAANGAGVDSAWPFLAARPPVLVDWLPLSHTFASNFNLNQILRHGGTLYLDEGRPQADAIAATLANLREVAPTLLYNVPRGFDLLVTAFENDTALARDVFRNLDIVFYAGAHLSASTWSRLMAVSAHARGACVPLLTSLGSTETGPVATLRHWSSEVADGVGDPIAGTTLKVVPNGEKYELRVQGTSVTEGYYNDAAATAAAFDAERFFKLGDAVRFIGSEPQHGLAYDGRLSENFKLSSGSWVHVGELRMSLLEALAPLAQDLAIAGPNRDELGILVFLNASACAGHDSAALGSEIARRLHVYNDEYPGASRAVRRCLLLATAPSAADGEITDKGYLNQRAVLAHRAAQVEALYARAGGKLIVV